MPSWFLVAQAILHRADDGLVHVVLDADRLPNQLDGYDTRRVQVYGLREAWCHHAAVLGGGCGCVDEALH